MDLDSLFDISPAKRVQMRQQHSVLLPPSLDTHIHCRTIATGQMGMVVGECAKVHAGIIDIANVPGITTPNDVRRRLAQILSWVPKGKEMQVRITPLINDHTPAHHWQEVWDKPDGEEEIAGVKIFWQGVSNDYGNSISSASAIQDFLRSTTTKLKHKSRPLVVTMHAECLKDYSGNVIPIKDREYWCMYNEVQKVVRYNPEGTYVIRHVSDYRTLEIIAELRNKGIDIHAEVSPQYFILIDDSLFTGEDGHAALQCNCIFWPRPKDAKSRKAIQSAALKGYAWMHIGQDYALHPEDPAQPVGVKINSSGIAAGGLNFLPMAAKSAMIDFFVANGRLEVLGDLMSRNPARLYGIQLPTKEEEYVHREWMVPEYIFGTNDKGQQVKSWCFLGNKFMHWQPA